MTCSKNKVGPSGRQFGVCVVVEEGTTRMKFKALCIFTVSILLIVTVFAGPKASLRAQAKGGDTSTERAGSDNKAQTTDNTEFLAEPTDTPTAEPAGVEEIAKAADNFNVSAEPTQEQAKTVVNAPPVLSPFDQAVARVDVEVDPAGMGDKSGWTAEGRTHRIPRGQSRL